MQVGWMVSVLFQIASIYGHEFELAKYSEAYLPRVEAQPLV
jgi:hypothetical protein